MSARAMIRARERAQARHARRGGLAVAAGLAAGAGPASAATIQVTNGNDAGPGSLRDAVNQANAAPGADTVTFAANATGTVKLGKKKSRLAAASAELAAGITERLTLVPASRRTRQRIAKLLKRGKKARASVEVTIDDGLGHSSTTDLKVKLKGKRKKPK